MSALQLVVKFDSGIDAQLNASGSRLCYAVLMFAARALAVAQCPQYGAAALAQECFTCTVQFRQYLFVDWASLALP